METPPELPLTNSALGTRFYVLLIAPLVATVLAHCCANHRSLGGPMLAFAGLVTIAISIALAGRPGQHFHLYLIAYGLFRFAHEFVRATPCVGSGITGYQLAAAAVFLLGAAGFVVRKREMLA